MAMVKVVNPEDFDINATCPLCSSQWLAAYKDLKVERLLHWSGASGNNVAYLKCTCDYHINVEVEENTLNALINRSKQP